MIGGTFSNPQITQITQITRKKEGRRLEQDAGGRSSIQEQLLGAEHRSRHLIVSAPASCRYLLLF